MADRRDIPDALKEAVERTVQATIETRERAQGAASELSASVDDLVRGAEKGLSRSRRSVRAAVGERLPATQDDVKAIRAELRRIGARLDEIERRLPAKAAAARKGEAKAKAGSGGKAKARSGGRAKSGGKARAAGTRAKPKR